MTDETGSGDAQARLEGLLARYAPQFGADAGAYGNHVRRVFGLVVAQEPG